ncbi:protein bric-a-brac 2-like isoform X2 [Battus philenor]|uniref:protein bric-a-brac 2-like isoform X2 n=1 Tax=Battus philenor TaxID=42288 RepID=UPI0035D0C90D
MVQSQFSLSWDSYKNNICSGFSSLQQNGEFVDMTLAADGHFVKVHQVLLALASPYLKDLIASVPCQHPVVFLNNISYTTLSLLLEYIYTGEVLVPATNFNNFVDAAKALHVKGLETVSHENITTSSNLNTSQNEETDICLSGGVKRLISTKDTLGHINLPVNARKILIKQESAPDTSSSMTIRSSKTVPNETLSKEDSNVFSDLEDTGGNDDDDEEYSSPPKTTTTSQLPKVPPTANTNLQFTVSIRGSLQVILNRYMYNLNSTQSTGVKRWRCVDYRNKKCMAFLVTKGNVVLNRANLHSHSYHDKKILAKIEKNAVFSALDDAEGYKEKESSKNQEETAMESEDYSFDLTREMNDENDRS